MTIDSPSTPPAPDAGPTCARSSLSPGLRLGIAFGALFMASLLWAAGLLKIAFR